MRKTIFALFSVLLAASIVFIPANSVAAKPDSPPQMSAPSPAQSAEEDTIIKDILVELDAAGKMANDPDIRKHIDVLKDWVKKLRDLIRRGDKKAALDTKLLIAERLEWLINQLPVTSSMPTTLAAAPTGASTNPLYDELVRIRVKIDKLIALERMPGTVPPPPPEIERPPEMERLIVYSAKFLCGPAFGREGVQPGSYSTAINVHNPHDQTVYLYKKAVIARPEDEPRGPISRFRKVRLGPDEAIEIDCIDIVSLFRGDRLSVLSPAPSQQLTTATHLQTSVVAPEDQPTPENLTTVFAKGFVVIYATGPLDVVAVYTASTRVGFSLDVEYLQPTTRGVVRVPPPEEGEECPAGCYCMTKEEAYGKLGPNATMCQEQPCDKDASGVLRYCWKPGEQVQCPQGCACLSKDDAYRKFGPNTSTCTDQPCGYAQDQTPLYCWKPGEQAACPQGCACLTEVEAKRLGLDLCQGQRTLCGYDQQQNPLYCFQKPTEQAECLQGCACLTKDDAYQRYGANAIQCQDAPCGYVMAATAAVQTPKYCWKPTTTTQPQCPQGCYCLTKDDAYNKLGPNAGLCQDTPCGYDQNKNPLYCFKPTPPTTTQCQQGCYCLAKADAEKRGYTTLCQNAPCGYDQYQNPLYCWKYTPPTVTPTTPPTQTQCPSGCTCLTKADAEKQGYTVLCQDSPCGYDQYRNPLYCFKKPSIIQTIPLIPRTIK